MGAKIFQDLELAFDVGHSSIGWAVLQSRTDVSPAANAPRVNILGCGVVTFGADDCLASKRRTYRSQRRHLRATRKRIAWMEKLLAQLGVLSTEAFEAVHKQAGGDSFAWQRAAEILANARSQKPLPDLGWPELWNILRWYAHNRGYFSPPWANREEDSIADDNDVPDTEKVERANAIMREFKTVTMAETISAYTVRYEQEVAEWQQKKRAEKSPHFKGLKAAFLRESVVWPEVRDLLTALKGKLPKLDDALIRTFLGNDPDPMKDREAWRTIPCPAIKLSGRYHGGLLFGQVIPRFDNRIIGVCPIQFARRQAELIAAGFSADDAKDKAAKESKLPSKATPEFLRFRWAMQLANIFGERAGERETRALSANERKQITERAERQGAFAKGEFKKAVREIAGWPDKLSRDNLDNLLMHPDAEKALVLDPAQREVHNSKLAAALTALPERFRKRLLGKLRRGQSVSYKQIHGWLAGADADAFDAEIQRVIEAANTKHSKKQTPLTRDELLAEKLAAEFPKGRAPYARPVLRQAYEEVMKGWDPRAEKKDQQPRGCLCQTDELKEAQLQRRLEEQTNNHLIRHRLLILGGEQPKPNAKPEHERRRFKGLLHDLIQEFANGDKSRIAGMTIEVNSELRDLSGKTRKAQEQDLGLRFGDFKRVSAKVEEACKRRGIRVTAGIIRKARVAEDLGWRCPYTGKDFCIDTLLDGVMDKDHIIPYADRESDSLDSLVITWNEVNKWKDKRTAMQFIRDEGGKRVPGRPELEIMALAVFQKHVAGLDTRKGHDDDRARKKRRIRRLLTEHYEEKEFTPRDLTVTSHLVRLGAQVLQRNFPKDQRPPVVSLPGSVTGEVRKAWKLTGCLEAANPAVMEEVEERDEATGELKKVRRAKKKNDIRGITHLHHALDACVLALSAHYFPHHGTVWSTMVKAGIDREADDDRRLWLAMTKRRPTPAEAALLKTTGLYKADAQGRMHLDELPEQLKQQLRQRLVEKRVVQHIPADMSGMRVQENTRGITAIKDGRVFLRQQSRDAKTGKLSINPTEESANKVIGLKAGKLTPQKGVRVITDNFGVAILDHAPEGEDKFVIVPWHKIWVRIYKGFKDEAGKTIEKSLVERNGGKQPRILRIGTLIRVSNPKNKAYKGIWMVRGVQLNQRAGYLVDISEPDVIEYRVPKRKDCKQNVGLKALVQGGLEILKTPLTGVVSPPLKLAE
jgi:CRISPR-associated endonuclease Csn1